MDPCVWGPPLWRLLHGSAVAPGKVRAHVMQCLASMRAVLPCDKCRKSLTAILAGLSGLRFANVFEVTWIVHNYVNRKLKKPLLSLSRARRVWTTASAPGDALSLVDSLVIIDTNYAQCGSPNKKTAYRTFWNAVRHLCALSPSMRPLSVAMGRSGKPTCGRANSVRTALVSAQGVPELRLSTESAARRARACRKQRPTQ